MKIFSQKKAEQKILKYISELLVGISIVTIFAYVGYVFGSGEYYEQTRIATDSALALNTIYSFADNPSFSYAEETNEYIFEMEYNLAKISQVGEDPTEANHYFSPTNTPLSKIYLKTPEILIIKKQGTEIQINQPISEKIKERCPSIKTRKPLSTIIIPKTIANEEFEFTKTLSNFLAPSETRDLTEIPEDAELIIEIIDSTSDETIIYYSPNIESRKLACLVYNNFIENGYKEISLIPSDNFQLEKAKISISIVLTKELQIQTTINAIKQALDNY